MRIDMSSTFRSADQDRPWSDLAALLNDIRSPQRCELEHAIECAAGEAVDAKTVSRIASAVIALYRRRHLAD